MANLKNPKWMYFKAVLFLLGGFLAVATLVLENPSIKTVLLLGLAIWCFARFYYFAFYVIQHYIDPTYRFSGLWSFARYLLRTPKNAAEVRATSHTPGSERT
jgi:hypothetical protein